MTEIEKMFKNVGIKPLCQIPDKFCGVQNIYEDFTADKQLELIKWLINEIDFISLWHFCNLKAPYDFNLGKYHSIGLNFEEALAGLINDLWQDLADQEKEEIRRILNE